MQGTDARRERCRALKPIGTGGCDVSVSSFGKVGRPVFSPACVRPKFGRGEGRRPAESGFWPPGRRPSSCTLRYYPTNKKGRILQVTAADLLAVK